MSAADAKPSSPVGPQDASQHRSPRLTRQLVELLICLGVAVTLFRTFEVEGYMISTGSMAPGLLGYHKRVTCPTCNYQFSRGVTIENRTAAEQDGQQRVILTRCPNCGQDKIDISGVPRNQGDQLLVNKHAFQLQAPRRWEVVVFKNPQNATQVYVKRIVGLPGETVQVVGGDIFINKQRSRKNMAQQRAIRIPVYDHDFEPRNDVEWQSRWIADPDSSWQRDGQGFVFRHAQAGSGQAVSKATDWLDYRHWIRSGGQHRTTAPLRVAPPELDDLLRAATIGLPLDVAHRRCPVSWDRAGRQLVCTGVMNSRWRDKLLSLSQASQFQQAVQVLHDQSHTGSISNSNGYNHQLHLMPTTAVRDVMISLDIAPRQRRGRLLVCLQDAARTYTCVLDFEDSQLMLLQDLQPEPLQHVALPEPARFQRYRLEVSLFDRQVTVALDGQEILPAVPLPPVRTDAQPPAVPIRIGGSALDARIDKLQTFRDVYYTRGKAINGVDQPHVLEDDEYFMLGDNSAVSADSRNWPQGSVHKRLLVGKPFVVHLPSRPGKLRIGDSWTHFRIPDFSRVRYIR